MEMSDKFLQGQIHVRLGLIYFIESGTRNYCFHFFRNDIRIAKIYYHNPAKQLVVEVCNEIVLIKETLDGLSQYLNMSIFRRQRRLGLSRIKRMERKWTNSD